MSREASLGIVIAAIILVVIVAGAAGAFGVRVTTDGSSGPVTTDGSSGPVTAGGRSVTLPDSPPRDGSAGVVFGQHESSGMSIFGLDLRSRAYTLLVSLVPPIGCTVTTVDGVLTLPSDAACEGVPVSGLVAGGGRTSEGDTIVIVSVEVSKGCYRAITTGDPWPSTARLCR